MLNELVDKNIFEPVNDLLETVCTIIRYSINHSLIFF